MNELKDWFTEIYVKVGEDGTEEDDPGDIGLDDNNVTLPFLTDTPIHGFGFGNSTWDKELVRFNVDDYPTNDKFQFVTNNPGLKLGKHNADEEKLGGVEHNGNATDDRWQFYTNNHRLSFGRANAKEEKSSDVDKTAVDVDNRIQQNTRPEPEVVKKGVTLRIST
ncbi:hypothetical protein PT974_04421 [Cladobotryum mycophilum]|uniref:Uncharacterized protein n=1 Tax=Cladobotryum mycophilum TaxID=491253 RepID=A0ABR0SV14_9HYPO